MTDRAFEAQLKGYALTTAEILYRLPDHPSLLQSFVWQDYDLHPRFPRLKTFLDYWVANLDGALHGVRIAHARLIRPAEFRHIGGELRLH
ncbi:MAG: usg protein [Hyphomicrobiaceae bacterium]|nr:usg protein [Hyphomicrobiaceae bacterium]